MGRGRGTALAGYVTSPDPSGKHTGHGSTVMIAVSNTSPVFFFRDIYLFYRSQLVSHSFVHFIIYSCYNIFDMVPSLLYKAAYSNSSKSMSDSIQKQCFFIHNTIHLFIGLYIEKLE